jgi:hypothetical protein
MEQQLLRVIFDGGWKICFRADAFGPFESKSAAIETARQWQQNAVRQGHAVKLLIDGDGEEGRERAALQ